MVTASLGSRFPRVLYIFFAVFMEGKVAGGNEEKGLGRQLVVYSQLEVCEQ